MGSYRSKEDDVSRISTSIFVTNFPDSFKAMDLFHVCKQYGHVVDSFIPMKKTKEGKRFGFVRFINVFSVERLVSNLCTIWVDRLKIQANIARFNRAPLNRSNVHFDRGVNLRKDQGFADSGQSYSNVVKGNVLNDNKGNETPVLVLDDNCLLSKDLSKCLLGRVKEFASLANLRMSLNNEGFMGVKIQYMGEMWVMLEFGNQKSLALFRDNVSVGSWFSQINQASMDFVADGRIAWVELEGIPFKMWPSNTFKRITTRWGSLLDFDDQEETCFHSKRLCIYTKSNMKINEDFKVVYRGNGFWVRAYETPGWVPDFLEDEEEDEPSEVESKDGKPLGHDHGYSDISDGEVVPDTIFKDDGGENRSY
ncbi:nucleotide-binding alpha-beta plait domain-containing protein [Tanacetum coccineum]